MTAHSRQSPPIALGPYRVLERIGVGGIAAVHRCHRHGASGFTKELAIKTLLPEHAHDGELQRRLIAEARLGAAMNHRNLVTIFDLGVDDGRYYVVMELVDGADLRTLHQGTAIPEALALYVVHEVAAALAYVHAFCGADGHPLGLVHRDVSPGNVLVSRSGEVKLADFGITKATNLAEQTQARIIQGKYAYLAPEQLTGKTVDARTDQFALGVTLAELTTGVRPFDGANAAQTMDRIRRGAAELEAVATDLLPIVKRCLAPDPADRFPDMATLCRALWQPRASRTPADALTLSAWCVPRCVSGAVAR
ncbi:MAG: serine/threonine-protein kinase [Myxococcota bacterium]